MLRDARRPRTAGASTPVLLPERTLITAPCSPPTPPCTSPCTGPRPANMRGPMRGDRQWVVWSHRRRRPGWVSSSRIVPPSVNTTVRVWPLTAENGLLLAEQGGAAGGEVRDVRAGRLHLGGGEPVLQRFGCLEVEAGDQLVRRVGAIQGLAFAGGEAHQSGDLHSNRGVHVGVVVVEDGWVGRLSITHGYAKHSVPLSLRVGEFGDEGEHVVGGHRGVVLVGDGGVPAHFAVVGGHPGSELLGGEGSRSRRRRP